MSTEDVLKEHQSWLDDVAKQLVSDRSADRSVANRVGGQLEGTQQQVGALKARIEALAQQKEMSAKRYDEAIAAYNDELARLEAAALPADELRQQIGTEGKSSGSRSSPAPAKKSASAVRAKKQVRKRH